MTLGPRLHEILHVSSKLLSREDPKSCRFNAFLHNLLSILGEVNSSAVCNLRKNLDPRGN